MSDSNFLLKISRPRFWLYILGPFLIGLVGGSAQPSDILNWKMLVFGTYFFFPANLLIYGINDIFDYETDRLNEKKNEYETLVEPDYRRKLWAAILLSNLPFIALSLFLGELIILAMGGFLFFSCFYSAPPIRAKTKPFLDSIFNILYLFPGIFAFILISGKMPPFIVIIAAGLWTMAMHAYSAIPDIEADQKAGLKTIATWLGSKGTLVFCLILYLSAASLVFQYIGFLSVFLAIIYALMIFISFQFDKSNQIFRVYKFFPLLNSVVGFVLFWTIALSKFDLSQIF